ncbi:MAG TPA: integration host factor subunit beta [Agitococcus sp.]|nr:integration host factor subunit beta [Agitococcus sp.]HMX99141.1 integration host factor subunit beta [Agitococcus sp.]HMY27527.1 integration host factor subunit beta [Agitococcus sp.]HMY82125.1 integration host factor subunit beta [Agitococcus sp.]HNC02618.1 integration host factor subunit beta [Agitococcus sp.]
MSLTKSELISKVAARQSLSLLTEKDIELAIKALLEQMVNALAEGQRVEIRGFGSFSLHHRPPRVGRNPKTGESVSVGSKYVPHFKPGKELKERVNQSIEAGK